MRWSFNHDRGGRERESMSEKEADSVPNRSQFNKSQPNTYCLLQLVEWLINITFCITINLILIVVYCHKDTLIHTHTHTQTVRWMWCAMAGASERFNVCIRLLAYSFDASLTSKTRFSLKTNNNKQTSNI